MTDQQGPEQKTCGNLRLPPSTKTNHFCECEYRSLLLKHRKLAESSALTRAPQTGGCQSSETAPLNPRSTPSAVPHTIMRLFRWVRGILFIGNVALVTQPREVPSNTLAKYTPCTSQCQLCEHIIAGSKIMAEAPTRSLSGTARKCDPYPAHSQFVNYSCV